MKFKIQNSKFKIQGGQTLIEVLVALVIGIIVVTAFVTLGAVAVRNSRFSSDQVTATKLATEGIEAMITIRDQNASGAIGGNGSNDQWIKLFPPYTSDGTMTCLGQENNPTATCANTDFILLEGTCSVTPPPPPTPTPSLQRCIEKNTTGDPLGPDDYFRRKIRISDPSPFIPNVKNVTVFVWWTDVNGLHKSILSRKLYKDRLE